MPEGETCPGKYLASPLGVPRYHPLPLPLGEVAERSEAGEGKQCPYPKTTPKEIIIQKKAATPSQSPAVTVLPRGEPRGCTFLLICWHEKRSVSLSIRPVDCFMNTHLIRGLFCADGRFVHICMVCFDYAYRRSFPAKRGGLEELK